MNFVNLSSRSHFELSFQKKKKIRFVHVNNFGSRLLNICKENDLYIVNGRKEPGQCKCYCK